MSTPVAKNTLYLTVASVAQKALAFFYFLLLARVMRPEATGDYFLALSITAIFSTVSDLGVTPVVIRDVAKFPERAADLIRRALWLKVPFMALATVGAIAMSWALGYDSTVRELVLIASLVMLADAASLLFYGVLRGNHALRFESLGIFVGQTCTLLFGGLVLMTRPSLHLLVLVLLAGSTFNALFSARRVVSIYGWSILRPRFDEKAIRTLLIAAIPFALAGIFVKVYSFVDSIIISKIIGTAAVGVYAVAYKFTYAFQFLPMAFVAALYPGMSAMVGKKDTDGLSRLFDDAIWYMTILAAPIAFGLWAVAGDAIALAGDGYVDAAPVLATLIFVLIPIFLDFPVGSLLNAANRQATKTAVMGATMVINVICNLLLIPAFGLLGAAYSAVISFVFLFGAGFWFIPKVIPNYGIDRLLRTVVPIVFSAAAMGIATRLIRPYSGFYPVLPIAVVLYVGMLALTRSIRTQHLASASRLIRRKFSYAKEDEAVHD